jgi:hypothetical protein
VASEADPEIGVLQLARAVGEPCAKTGNRVAAYANVPSAHRTGTYSSAESKSGCQTVRSGAAASDHELRQTWQVGQA